MLKIGQSITFDTQWLLANGYLPEDFMVPDECIFVFDKDTGRINYLEKIEGSIAETVIKDEFDYNPKIYNEIGYVIKITRTLPYLEAEVIGILR